MSLVSSLLSRFLSRSPRPGRSRLYAATGLAVLALVTVSGFAVAQPGAEAPSTPAGADSARKVIVDVAGDKANGFEVHYADGSAIFPPTDSEARAECGEYDTRVGRVRCRVEVATWYRDLGDLQRSLAFVRAESGGR